MYMLPPDSVKSSESSERSTRSGCTAASSRCEFAHPPRESHARTPASHPAQLRRAKSPTPIRCRYMDMHALTGEPRGAAARCDPSPHPPWRRLRAGWESEPEWDRALLDLMALSSDDVLRAACVEHIPTYTISTLLDGCCWPLRPERLKLRQS